MAWTPNARWAAAFDGDASVAVLLTIRYAAATDVTWCFNPIGGPLFGYPNVVADMVPLSQQLDIKRQSVRLSTIDFTVIDHPEVRAIISGYQLHNKRATVKIGTPGLVEGDFETVWTGVIASHPSCGYTSHVIAVGDSLGLLGDRNMKIGVVGSHPVEVLAEMVDFATGAVALRDASSYLPATYSSDISHYNLHRAQTRFGVQAVTDGANVLAMIQEVCELIQASIVPARDGTLEIKRANPAGSAQALLTTGQISSMTMGAEPPINRIIMNFDWRGEEGQANRSSISPTPVVFTGRGNTGTRAEAERWMDNTLRAIAINVDQRNVREMLRSREYRQEFIKNDATSQSALAYHGSAASEPRIFEHHITTRWCNAWGYLRTDLAISATGAVLDIYSDGVAGFCGLAGYVRPTVPAAQQLSAARKAYIRIDKEIVECTAVTPVAGEWTFNEYDEIFENLDFGPRQGINELAYAGQWTISARGCFDTDDAAHTAYNESSIDYHPETHMPRGMCWDVTIPVLLCENLLQRNANGSPIVTVGLSLAWDILELRDLVELEHDAFLHFGYDGIADADNVMWEVIGKETSWLGIERGVTLTLAPAWDGKMGAVDHELSDMRNDDAYGASVIGQIATPSWGQWIAGGMAISVGAGPALDIDRAFGTCVRKGGGIRFHPARTLGLDDNKDHYLSVSGDTGLTVCQQVAIGAAAPTQLSHAPRLAFVNVTAGVITVTDQRQMTAQMFSAYSGAAGAKAMGAGVWSQIQMDTVVQDLGMNAYQAANFRYAAPYDIKLPVEVSVEIVGDAAGDIFRLGLFVTPVGGAAALYRILDSETTHAAAQEVRLNGTCTVELAEGEYLDVRVYYAAAGGGPAVWVGSVEDTWWTGGRIGM